MPRGIFVLLAYHVWTFCRNRDLDATLHLACKEIGFPKELGKTKIENRREFFLPRLIHGPSMPAQFDSFGIRFLYPDNWKVAARDESEGDRGATFDLPDGGFLSIERTESATTEELTAGIIKTMADEYDELESEEVSFLVAGTESTAIDLRFYYLDLLIVSRIVVIATPGALSPADVLVFQLQAESREFDRSEEILAAIVKQIVD